MEGQKKTNWADESDEEWSEHEEISVPQAKTHSSMPDERKELLIGRIKRSSFPLTLQLSNLSFHVKEEVLISALHLSVSAQYTFLKGADGRFSGLATVTVESLEDALLLAEKFNSDVHGRSLLVRVSSEGYGHSGERGHRGGRPYGGDRGGYQGGERGYRGGERGHHGGGYRDRGGYHGAERGHQGGFQAERSYQKVDRGYQGEERSYQGTYQSERGKREGGRGNRRGGRNSHFEERQHVEKRNEFRPKDTEAKPSKITIAPTGETPVSQTQVVQKPRSNPFGQARPVDTLVKDLEFEKKLEETKKVVEEPPREESKYKVKEVHEQGKHTDEVRGVGQVREVKETQEAKEIKEVKEEKKETAKPADSDGVELKEEVSYERPRENYRGRGGRRGERYRKKYPNESEPVEEQRNPEDERNFYDNKRRANQRRSHYEHGARRGGGDYHVRNTEEIHRSEHTEKPQAEEKVTSEPWNAPEVPASQPRKQSDNANLSAEVEIKQQGDSENYKRNSQGGRRPHENKRRYDEGGYDSNKRRYDDPNRSNEYKPRGNYENRKQNPEKSTYSEEKKPVEEKPIVIEEKDEIKYKSKYENKNKEANKVKAWGNPDEAAEIIKKPKDTKVEEEEKTTKLGSQYVKRKVQE